MTELKTTTLATWSSTQAFALAAVALVFGVCGGWILRRATAPSSLLALPPAMVSPAAPSPVEAPPPDLGPVAVVPVQADLQKATDSEVAPLLEQLKTAPTDAALLARIGNIYYDARQYPGAIKYYERSLEAQPSDTSVRTDLGAAYWYSGNADTAIGQFNRALAYDPTKADTLFNLGIVEWQGKKNAKSAIAAWQRLLDANPGYANRDKVEQLIAQAHGN